MNEQELNKKLAEWAGVKLERTYEQPFDGLYGYYCRTPDFTQSLDACFKWLVPKLFGGSYSIIITQDLARAIAYIRPLVGGRQFDATDNHKPALALCLAIEKLIDGEKKLAGE